MGTAAAKKQSEEIEQHEGAAIAGDVEQDHQAKARATSTSHVAIDDELAKDQAVNDDALAPAVDQSAAPANDSDVTAGKTLQLGGYGHVWLKGDTLWKVSEQYYGDGRYWRKISAANTAKLKGVKEGQVLDIPPMSVDTLTALLRFKDQPDALRALVSLMPREDYEGFFEQLTPAQVDRHGQFLQVLELMRSTGKTVRELAAEQRAFLKDQAAAEGQSIGEMVGGVVATKGYGGSEATAWKKLTSAQRLEWGRRFRAVVAAVKAAAPPDVAEIIHDAERQGGGFRWSPEDVEKSHAFAYTIDNSWELHCGVEWVKAAESDPASVHGNIAHEMGGHNYYGSELGYAIQKGALTKDEEKAAAKSGNSLFSAYGYMETEIFAELYEFPYNFPDTPGREYPSDTAFETDKAGNDLTHGQFKNRGDVVRQLKRIKEAFAPDVARGLVDSLARRIQIDPRIVPMAKERFREAVLNVFVAPP